MWIYPTGSPRPFGPGLPDGPSGYGITGMNMYNTMGGNDFYSRVAQTGKDDLSLHHCRQPFLSTCNIKMFPLLPPAPSSSLFTWILYKSSKHLLTFAIIILHFNCSRCCKLKIQEGEKENLEDQTVSGRVTSPSSCFSVALLWMEAFIPL